MQKVGQYHALPVAVNGAPPLFLFCREHNVTKTESSSSSEKSKKGRILFIINVPSAFTESHFKKIFAAVGKVKEVTIGEFSEPPRKYVCPSHARRPNAVKAHVTFASKKALKALFALTASDLPLAVELPFPRSAVARELSAALRARSTALPSPASDQHVFDCAKYMESARAEEGRAARAARREMMRPDADGWVTVPSTHWERWRTAKARADPLRPDILKMFSSFDAREPIAKAKRAAVEGAHLYRHARIAARRQRLSELRKAKTESRAEMRRMLDTGLLQVP